MTMDTVVGLPQATIGRRLWRQQGTSRTCARPVACRIPDQGRGSGRLHRYRGCLAAVCIAV